MKILTAIIIGILLVSEGLKMATVGLIIVFVIAALTGWKLLKFGITVSTIAIVFVAAIWGIRELYPSSPQAHKVVHNMTFVTHAENWVKEEANSIGIKQGDNK